VSHSVLNVQRTREFFTAACLSLESLMARFGHERIDLLKLDIEGAEGPLLDAMLAGPLRPGVLCVEFDRPEPPWALRGRLRRLERAGYVVRQAEDRNYTLTRD